MKTLKRMTVALLALLPLATGLAFADEEHGYSRIFVFGASLIDPGNRYADTGLVSTPPFLDPLGPAAYEIGGHRATNGRTWVEVMAQEMGLTKWAKPAYRNPGFGNYAYDHARIRDVEPPYITWGPSLSEQVELWAANGYCDVAPMNDTLFVIDSGGADLLDVMLLPEGASPYPIILEIMAAIKSQVETLYGCGARNFLIADLFPIGYAPGVALVGDPVMANVLTQEFNAVLQGVLSAIVSDPDFPGLNISTTGFFEYGMMLMNNWEDFGFTNATDSCVTFFVVEDAYCDRPKGYFFWDMLHPSKTAHALLAVRALAALPQPD